MLLAIDTSTHDACLALCDGDTLLAELNWRVGQRHGSELLERARWLLQGQGVEMRQLDGIAVARGPGSFNGVRVALATAKALAFALATPLYGVPTLDVIGWGARLSPDPIWALLEAGRGEVYAACYDGERTASDWRPLPLGVPADAADAGVDTEGAYSVTVPQALAARISGRAIFTGEWREATSAALTEALGPRARFTSPLAGRRGAWLAELAQARAQRGLADDPRALEPLYVRRPAITTSARLAGRAAAAPQRSAGQAAQMDGEEAAHAL